MKISQVGANFIRNLFPRVPGIGHSALMTNAEYSRLLEFGGLLRDHWLEAFSILPGAVNSYIEVVASREWSVVGAPRAAKVAHEKLLTMSFTDAMGIKHTGYEECLKLRCMDWLTVGRTAIYSPKVAIEGKKSEYTYFQYLDPTFLTPFRNDNKVTVWKYDDPDKERYAEPRYFNQEEVLFNDCVVKGARGLFIGKVAYLMPIARLDWLLREHIAGKLDGRKMVDIILVDSEDMLEGLTDAYAAAISMAAGEIASGEDGDITFPIVSLGDDDTGGMSSQSVKDRYAILGISQIPEVVKPEEATLRYVNEISATLGLGPRYYWTDTRLSGTRGSDQISEERQAVQGPGMFVRSDQRCWNKSGFLGEARMHYQEEMDSISAERKAVTFDKTMDAFGKLVSLVSPKQIQVMSPDGTTKYESVPRENPDAFSPEYVVDYLTRQKILPADLQVDNLSILEEDSVTRSIGSSIQPGEIRIDRNGAVVEKRQKLFKGKR